MMNNEKGYTYAGTLFVILIITTAFLFLAHTGFSTDTIVTSESNKISKNMVSELNGKERIHALLYSNVSYEGEKSYGDLNKKYTVSTVGEEYEQKTLSIYNSSKFKLNNKTDVKVDLYVTPVDNLICNYSVSIMNGSYDLIGGQGSSLSGDTSFIIKGEKLYNKETDETNYGEYVVNMDSNCSLSGTITYDNLLKREVLLKTSGYQRNILITRNEFAQEVKFN